MEAANKATTRSHTTHRRGNNKTHVESVASGLLRQGKKIANAFYEDSLNKIDETEEQLKEYSDDVLKKVQRNPLASVLIAASIGYILARIFKS